MSTMSPFSFIFVLFCLMCGVSLAKKVIYMEDFVPEKTQGTWFVLQRNLKLFDSIKCVKYNLKHDPNIDDLYAMTTWWVDSGDTYLETHFNIVDDRSLKARFFFESHKDKVACTILGTDYNNWLVGFGVNGDKETYYVSSRNKTLTPEAAAKVQEILKKNEVERDWMDVEQMSCPDEH